MLNAPLRFFDTTPTGRILNRFSNDITTVDGSLPFEFKCTWEYATELMLSVLVVITSLPMMLIASIGTIILVLIGAEFYIRAQISVRRIASVTMSPLITNFNDGLVGNVVIRAFSRQKHFLVSNLVYLNTYTISTKTLYNLNRWIGNYIGLCEAIMPIAAGFLAFAVDLSPRLVGFNLTTMQSLQRLMIEGVRSFNCVETDLNSIERISYYLHDIDQEPEATTADEPPASWPMTGRLEVRNLSIRYHTTAPDVLKGVDFDILPGERVGVVGSTGVGKSSLAISLLRFTYISSGSIQLDGRDITKTNLHSLRRRITFIPQDPACLRGSMKFNLDPFDEVDDTELNAALSASGLVDNVDAGAGSSAASTLSAIPQNESRRKQITLDTQISHGGENLSQGQRQLLAFARALVRRSKLIILDEATSYTDSATDAKIQETIRTSFKDCSILTIAHRLRTIMSFDRILVLANTDGGGGRVVEFDTPLSLLRRRNGVLAKFARDTGEFEELERMASGGHVR